MTSCLYEVLYQASYWNISWGTKAMTRGIEAIASVQGRIRPGFYKYLYEDITNAASANSL